MGSAAWRLARQPPPPARPARPGSTARLPGAGQGQTRARDLAHFPPVCRPTLARRWALSWATLAEPAGEPLAPPPPDEAAPLRGSPLTGRAGCGPSAAAHDQLPRVPWA